MLGLLGSAIRRSISGALALRGIVGVFTTTALNYFLVGRALGGALVEDGARGNTICSRLARPGISALARGRSGIWRWFVGFSSAHWGFSRRGGASAEAAEELGSRAGSNHRLEGLVNLLGKRSRRGVRLPRLFGM
jgi:hypothetical protein